MKKIALLATGGTIACEMTAGGLAPALRAADLLTRVPALHGLARITPHDVFALDSSNIQPEEWQALARAAHDALQTADAAVVTHGTDTMAYSAAALSYMLAGCEKPVVFTGAQLPLTHPLSDAGANLTGAVAAACAAPRGVYVAFHQKIIRGVRAVKLRTTSFDAFDSVNAPLAGRIDADGVTLDAPCPPPPVPLPPLCDALDSRVFLLRLMPGTDPAIFSWIVRAGYRGVVLEAFGLGGLHYIRRNLLDGLRLLCENGVLTLVTTQCLYEKADFSVYEVGRGILSEQVLGAMDMTTEAAVTKLMWVLGDGARLPLLRRSVCGEVTEAGAR